MTEQTSLRSVKQALRPTFGVIESFHSSYGAEPVERSSPAVTANDALLPGVATVSAVRRVFKFREPVARTRFVAEPKPVLLGSFGETGELVIKRFQSQFLFLLKTATRKV